MVGSAVVGGSGGWGIGGVEVAAVGGEEVEVAAVGGEEAVVGVVTSTIPSEST